MLGLLGGLLLSALLIAIFEREKTSLRKVSIGGIIAVVIFVGLFFSLKNTAFVQNSLPLKRLADISLSDPTTQSRFIVWGMGWKGFLDDPILGKGQENFNVVFNKYYDPFLYNHEPWFDRAHNVVMDWLTSGGILGLLTYFGLFIATLMLVWKRGSPFSIVERSLLTGVLAGYFFHNIFVFDNVVSYILFATVLGYVYSRTIEGEDNVVAGHALQPGVQHGLAVLVVAGVIWSLYFFNVPGMLASRTLIESFRSQAEGPEVVLAHYDKALSYDTYSNQEVREQLLRAAQVVATRSDVTDEVKQKFVSRAHEEMAKEIEEHPHDARTQLFMGDFLNRFRQYPEARQYLDRAHELSPGKQTILFALTDNAFGQSNLDEALEFAKEALELEPKYRLARTYYAAMLIYSGKTEEAEALLIEEYGTAVVPESVLINAYANTDNVSMVIELWRERIKEDPNNVQARISLAASYVRVGDTEQAIVVLQQAGVDIQDFKEQSEVIIEQIRSGELQ